MKLTFRQVIKQIEIDTSTRVNEATLAFQRNRFIEYVDHIEEGGKRKYNQESIEVLKIINSMYKTAKTYEDIKDVLEKRKYGVLGRGSISPQPENVSTGVVQPTELEHIIKRMFQDRDEEIVELKEELIKRDKTIIDLQEKLKRDKKTFLEIRELSFKGYSGDIKKRKVFTHMRIKKAIYPHVDGTDD